MAKKHLGQNFLTSSKFIGDVITAASVTKDDTVLEIGPGKGALTKELLEAAGKVIAVEKDVDLIPYLEEKFQEELSDGRFTLMHGDIVDIDLSEHVPQNYKLVANIPFYITGLIIRTFLESNAQPQSMTLIVQKEVAERIVARDNKQSVLSISVQAFGTPKLVGKIPARYFSPKPQVDSAILHINDISEMFFETIEQTKFFETVKTGFEHKRKMLINNLEALYPKETLLTSFSGCSVSKKVRAEELTLQEWKCLSETLL